MRMDVSVSARADTRASFCGSFCSLMVAETAAHLSYKCDLRVSE